MACPGSGSPTPRGFPDALEINPYVTIMALADRVAEAIRADSTQLLG